MTCATAAGVGRNHPIALWVGRQWSNTYDANMSYSGPVVAGYDASWLADLMGENEGAVTQGGEWVEIEGAGFGTVEQRRRAAALEAFAIHLTRRFILT